MNKPEMPADFKNERDAILANANARGLTVKEFALEIWKYS
jgi:hypothetical protein